MLDGPVAQHEMREIQVEFMRRHVGALGHETHVAERAGVDHGLERGAMDAVELAAVGLVDEVEQQREAVAQIEAATTTVANVENPAELGIEFIAVVEFGVTPRDRMAGRRAQTAFLHDTYSQKKNAAGPWIRAPPSSDYSAVTLIESVERLLEAPGV